MRMATAVEGEVTQVNSQVYAVDLEQKICDCGRFQENGTQCGAIGGIPRQYLPEVIKISVWKRTYLTNLKPVSLDDLDQFAVDIVCNPPVRERAPIGRPQAVRKKPEYQGKSIACAQARLNGTEAPPSRGKSSQACRKCRKYGHNRKTCQVIVDI